MWKHLWVIALVAGGAVAQEEEASSDETTLQIENEDNWLHGWSGSAEVGLNGSDGNTERLNLRAGIGGERDTSKMRTTFDLTYSYAEDDGEDTENRFRAKGFNEWKIEDPWSLFVQGSATYDEFQDWEWLLTAAGGVGYKFIDNDKTFLQGLLGAGISKEIKGTKNEIVPEGLIGLDFNHKLTERSEIYADFTFYPALDNFGPYRFEGNAGYKVLLDEAMNLSLKLGISDRYDSEPGEGFKRNDIDYFAVMAFDW
ncbi:MAG: DUF481 domain-containing protein [Phycisphaerales bacterium]|nr:DUF481 domain-containing protein [Phycisphaerales bacterium]